MLKFTNIKVIDVGDWDSLVIETYGRPYSFQQQDDCRSRGIYTIVIPDNFNDDFENDSISFEINSDEMGVSFKSWLERDPNQKLNHTDPDYYLELWYHRNFYPNIETLANDLYSKGLIESGKYLINIDW